MDTINPATMQYDNRQVDQDIYTNFGTEARFLSDYMIKEKKYTISAGLRYYRGNTNRSRLGVGDTGTGFNTDFVVKHQDLGLFTYNTAAFVENIFRIGKKIYIIPGARMEFINMEGSGRIY
jgi:Fe(3+) dicitrate transport protein